MLFFYSGFVLGTLLCALAPDYHFLLGARIITGIFGGVISSVSFAIITDLFTGSAWKGNGFGPLMGKLSDRIGKFRVFVIGSIISMAMVAIYTNLGPTPLWMAIALNVLLFLGISSRMISSSALLTAVPKPQDRGAFMSINSSVQQISGGIASAVAGMIVVQSDSGLLEHYEMLGFVVIASMLVAVALMGLLNRQVQRNTNTFSKTS